MIGGNTAARKRIGRNVHIYIQGAMNTVCPNCRNPTAVDATECVKCGASFSANTGWKPAPLHVLARSDRSTQDALRRISIVATIISLLCISAFAIYFYLEGSSFEGFVYLVPFSFHAIALFLLLQRPDGASITIGIGALGIILSLLLIPISLLTWAFHNTPLLFIASAVYFVCQLASVILGGMWKKSAQKS